MTYQEKVREYYQKDSSFVFLVFALALVSAVYWSEQIGEKSTYLSVGTLNFGFLWIALLLIFSFSWTNMYYLKVLYMNLCFKKENYTDIDDLSVEFMMGKSVFAWSFIGAMFFCIKIKPIESGEGLFLTIALSFVIGVFVSIMVTVCAGFYFNRFVKEKEIDEKDKQPATVRNMERVFCPHLFSVQWKELQNLLDEVDKKQSFDVATKHRLVSNMNRVKKSMTLYGELSTHSQATQQDEIFSMISQVKETFEKALQEEDEKISIEIKKQQKLVK